MHLQRGSIIRGIIIYFIVAFAILFTFVTISHKIMSPLEGVAKAFFQSIEEKRLDDAYLMLSDNLRAQGSKADFHEFLKKYDLYSVKKVQWYSPAEKGKRGRILGNMQMKSTALRNIELIMILEPTSTTTVVGEVVDLSQIPFVNEIDIWKIDQINFPNHIPNDFN